jgi:hypothetical protein
MQRVLISHYKRVTIQCTFAYGNVAGILNIQAQAVDGEVELIASVSSDSGTIVIRPARYYIF